MNHRKRIRELKKRLRKDKENLQLRLQLASLYRESGQVKEAIGQFIGLAYRFYEQRQLEQSNAMCSAVLELSPVDPKALELRKVVRLEMSSKRSKTQVDEDANNWIPSLAKNPTGPMPTISDRPATDVDGPTAEKSPTGARAVEHSEMLTPTPLPAPLAPHDADEHDSMYDGLERYKLQLKNELSGPVPQISLPSGIRAIDDTEDGDDERRTTTRPDIDREQLPRDHDTSRMTTQRSGALQSSERATSPRMGGIRMPTDADGEPEASRKTPVFERIPLDNTFEPWTAGGIDSSGIPGMLPPPKELSERVYADVDSAVPISRVEETEMTTRMPRAQLQRFEWPDFEPSTPMLELPPRPDGLPHVIHDDMDIGAAFSLPPRVEPESADTRAPLAAFADMPVDALSDLAGRITLRHYATDQYIVRQDDRARAFYSVVRGMVSVVHYDSADIDGDYEELCRLSSGDFFGGGALLPARRCRASVRAVQDCDIYEIPRRLLRETAAVYPEAQEILERVYRSRLIDALMASHPYLRGLSESRRQALRAVIQPVHCRNGHVLITEGAEAGGLYVVALGAVEVTKWISGTRAMLMKTVEEGWYFGDMASLRGSYSNVTVRAVGPTELLMLPAPEYHQLLSESPELWDEICERRGRQALDRNNLMTSPSIMV